jgi:hypothetical protein
VGTVRLHTAPPWFVGLGGLVAGVSAVSGMLQLGDDRLGAILAFSTALFLAANAAFLHQIRLVADDRGLLVPAGIRASRVPWSQLRRVRLDWTAPTGDRDRHELVLELAAGDAVRANVPAGVFGQRRDRRDQLEAALHERARTHGFELDVTPLP